MSVAEHERFREDVGAYLLGALAEPEHAAFERHLESCHVCRDELERLQVAAEALPRSVEQYEPPPSLKQALMEQVYSEADSAVAPRRSWLERLGLGGLTPRTALAGTAAVLLVGLVAGFAISQLAGNGQDTRTVAATVDPTRTAAGARAELVVPDGGDGSGELRVTSMPQAPPGKVYEIWLKRGDRVEPGPLFSVDRNGTGVGAVPGDLDGVDAVLVTRERAGGATQPSEAPIVTAKV